MRILITGLLACLFALPVRAELLTPEGGFQDPRTAAAFKAFEEICLPFALHKSELPLTQNIAHHQNMMTQRGYGAGKRSVSVYERYLYPAGSQVIKYPNPSKRIDVKLVFTPLLQGQTENHAGYNCEISSLYEPNLESEFDTRLIAHEPDWQRSNYLKYIDMDPRWREKSVHQNSLKTSSGIKATVQKFTVFNGVSEVLTDNPKTVVHESSAKEFTNLHLCAYGDPDSVFIQMQIKKSYPAFIESGRDVYTLRLKATRFDCGKSAE